LDLSYIEAEEYQIAVIGSSNVGKSAIVQQFINRTYTEIYEPTIEDKYIKYIEINEKLYGVEIIDLSGQDEYEYLRELYMCKANGFLVVYSLNDTNSILLAQNFYHQIMRAKDKSEIEVVLVGNKIDLFHDITEVNQDISSFATKYDISTFYVSAKLNINIDTVFMHLISLINNKQCYKPMNNIKKSKIKKPCCIL